MTLLLPPPVSPLRPPLSKTNLYVSWICGVKRIAIALTDRVIIRPPVLSVVGAVGLVPRSGVLGAVCALGYIVDRENIGVEEIL